MTDEISIEKETITSNVLLFVKISTIKRCYAKS